MKRWNLTIVICLVGSAAGCGGGGGYDGGSSYPTGTTGTPATPGVNEVIATSGSAFNPAARTVAAGTVVTFTFETVAHDVFFDAAPGAPANIDTPTANASVTRTFSTAGSFSYTCHIHPTMHGTIVVQ